MNSMDIWMWMTIGAMQGQDGYIGIPSALIATGRLTKGMRKMVPGQGQRHMIIIVIMCALFAAM